MVGKALGLKIILQDARPFRIKNLSRYEREPVRSGFEHAFSVREEDGEAQGYLFLRRPLP